MLALSGMAFVPPALIQMAADLRNHAIVVSQAFSFSSSVYLFWRWSNLGRNGWLVVIKAFTRCHQRHKKWQNTLRGATTDHTTHVPAAGGCIVTKWSRRIIGTVWCLHLGERVLVYLGAVIYLPLTPIRLYCTYQLPSLKLETRVAMLGKRYEQLLDSPLGPTRNKTIGLRANFYWKVSAR